MMLSVLSTLARRDLDPWTEAADLATLPVDAAARRLASLIAGLPGTAGGLEAGGAKRLILLLPKHASSTAFVKPTTLDDALGTTKGSLVIWMILMSLITGAQFLTASRQPPAPTKQAIVSAAPESAPTKGSPRDSSR